MNRQSLLFALDRLEELGVIVPLESYGLAQHADLAHLAGTDPMEAALFFCDWGIRERRARQRHAS